MLKMGQKEASYKYSWVIITTNIMLFWMYLLVHIPLPLQDNADLHTCLLDEEVSRSTGKEEEGQIIHHSTLYRTL